MDNLKKLEKYWDDMLELCFEDQILVTYKDRNITYTGTLEKAAIDCSVKYRIKIKTIEANGTHFIDPHDVYVELTRANCIHRLSIMDGSSLCESFNNFAKIYHMIQDRNIIIPRCRSTLHE